VKYTEAGDVRLRVHQEAARVWFEVTDTGIGIAPENQVRIFDRFWQVDGGATRPFGGMGIGLAAAREYARLLGGDVEVESELVRPLSASGCPWRIRPPDARAASVTTTATRAASVPAHVGFARTAKRSSPYWAAGG
jgi:signal transduction histidine kinase